MTKQVSIQISDIEFSAAHFVSEGGKCERLHGHNYQVTVMLVGEIDTQGMVMDFRELKRRLRVLCDAWDHRILLPTRSTLIQISIEENQVQVITPDGVYSFPSQDVVHLDVRETTAEELARLLCEALTDQLKQDFHNVHQASVTVAESRTSQATVSLEW